jgi:hypothetical protein
LGGVWPGLTKTKNCLTLLRDFFLRLWNDCNYYCERGGGVKCGMLFTFFWVIQRRQNFIWRRFWTHCSIFTGR